MACPEEDRQGGLFSMEHAENVGKKCNKHIETHTRRTVIYPRPEVILSKWRSSPALQHHRGVFLAK